MINNIYKFFDSKPTTLYILTFLVFGLVRLVMLQWDPIGIPDDHDEYANLLQAETFAEGRLSNDTHPFSKHFESFHILQHPTYASKYPPGQAFFLFVGLKLFGHPWYGVLLSCMLMVSCIVWMVRGYLSIKWALWIGIILVIRFALWNYWSSSYWGGAVAAIGGVLIFGAIPRLKSEKNSQVIISSLCFGLGLALLSQTRPFEGLLVSIIPALYLLKLVFQHFKNKHWKIASYLILPASIVMIANLAFSTYYNYKITGDPLKMPYSLHADQYSVQPPFLFLDKREIPPAYNHLEFDRQYNGWEIIEINDWKDYIRVKRRHFVRFIRFFYYWPFLIGLCFLFINRQDIEIPYWSFMLFCSHILFTTWYHPHYFAPALAIYYLILLQCAKYLMEHQNKLIRMTARFAIPVLLLITLADSKFFATSIPGYINGTQEYVYKKQQIIDELNQDNSKHLVLVKYTTEHKLHEEWVYNGPSLDESKILWARYLSKESNDSLKHFFRDRKTWLIHADEVEVKLSKY